MARPRDYARLVRLPNVATAAADSLSGWLLAVGTFAQPVRWLPLLGASMAIYAAGIALNDVFDAELDRVERPERPIPSGRISRRAATRLGVGLLILGPALAALSGSLASLATAAALAACVLAYDAALRRTVLGPQVMGLCRALNVLLGMSQAPDFGGPMAWLVAAAMGLFVTGITWISRAETVAGRRAGIASGMALQAVGLLALLAAATRPGAFPGAPTGLAVLPLEGLLVLVLAALVVNRATGRALVAADPATTRRAVKTGVLALVWLHVGVVAGVRGPGPALAVAALWPPAWALARWIAVT